MIDYNYSNKIDTRYILVASLAVVTSWVLHEFAHWTTGELLGNTMSMTLNKCFPVAGKYAGEWDHLIVSAGGPLFTMVEALIIFLCMYRKKLKYLYPFLFTCFYMRFFALVISFINPNDEARISKALNIGTFTLPIIVSALLFLLLYLISRQYRFNAAFNFKNLGLVIFFSSVVILTDQYFHFVLL